MACDKCNQTGKVVHKEPPSSEVRDFGNGITVQNMGGHITRPCSCVKDLPPVDGKATWWDAESVYSAEATVAMHSQCVEINARVEVPRAEDGRRVHRTQENFWYPTWVEIEGPDSYSMFPEEARKFAAMLIAAAEACEKADDVPAATHPEQSHE